MVFIETPVFTRQVSELLKDEEYSAFQLMLAAQPTSGDVIQGTGGLRKVRWAVKGRGKSGGVRVIYFHVAANNQVRLLVIYRKGVKDNLTADEKRYFAGSTRSGDEQEVVQRIGGKHAADGRDYAWRTFAIA